jgi:predicted DNA-binding transcriptional regulator AlpA
MPQAGAGECKSKLHDRRLAVPKSAALISDNQVASASRRRRADFLPHNLPPIMLDRIGASAYYGISTALFDKLLDLEIMPRPRRLGDKRKGWLVSELNEAAKALPVAERPQLAKAS